MKHLLKMLDLSGEEILEILDLADQLKYELKHSIPHPYRSTTLYANMSKNRPVRSPAWSSIPTIRLSM